MKFTCAAAVLCCAGSAVLAAEIGGLEITGYSRGGGVYSYNKDQQIKGGLTLGGDLQKYRLGNEGDAGLEVNIAKIFTVDDLKYKLHYMPSKWGNNSVGTEQAFVEMSGLSFAPEAKVWVGQRRLRIQDVHIVDHFLMDYGANQGAGFTDLNLGAVKVGAALLTGDSIDQKMTAGTSANKFNLDISEINTNPGGKVRVLLTAVSTSGLVNSGGLGWTVSHSQADFLTKGLTNQVFVQTSSGYANINGRFGDISAASVHGKKTNRIADAVQWQRGRFGGQALVGYQTTRADNSTLTTYDTSLGGRVSYAYTKHFKMLLEAGTTARRFSDASPTQHLNKITFAPTLALSEDFWSRPELRFYVTRANWNQAAADAHADPNTGFGANGRTSQTLAGVQYEVWW